MEKRNRNGTARGFVILVARLTARQYKRIFSLCHYFAIMKPVQRSESRHLRQNEMAGLKGKSGPLGNMNAFKHGLAAIQKRREESITTEHEENVRRQILDGLIADKGGDQQVSTATRILAEVIASDAAWLIVFNGAIDHIIQNNPKARQNPRGLSQARWLQAWTGELADWESPKVRPGPGAQDRN